MSSCRPPWLAAPAAVLLLALAGCGSTSHSSTAGGAAATNGKVTVATATGVTVLPHVPHRIVSLSATSTEDLFAIGAGGQVVAVDENSDYPANAPHTKLSGFQPSVEAIAAYRPDAVVISDGSPSFLAPALRKVGVPVLLLPAARSLRQAYEQIEQLGTATDHAAGAQQLVTSIKLQISRYVASTAGAGHGLSVYDEIEPSLYAANSTTFVGGLLTLFGLRNVADGAPDKQGVGYPQLSAEYLLRKDPDLVLLSDTICCSQSPATLAKRPGWSATIAVRDHTIVPVSDDIASRWGPRVVDLTAAIASAVAKAHQAGLHG